MAVVFDSVGFSAELDSLKKKVSDKLKAQLKTVATEEAQSQLDDKSPNDAQAYTRFCDKITVRNGVKKVDKSIIPEDVYKAIMLEAAVRDKTISKGFDIGNLDGKTVSAVASWFQGIFGETTTTVKVGEKNYTVIMRDNYSAQVKFPSGNTYSVTWTLDDTAKNALKAYIADLKDYLVDYRYQIYGAIVKDGMSSLIREFVTEIAEGVDSAKDKLITGFHDWALNNITETGVDVAINKILPKTYKQIKNVEKNYKTFINKFNDLKTYAKKVTDDSIKTNKKYTAFVTAYNNLDTGDQINGLIDEYLRYSFSDVTRDEITESNAKISGTSDADSIKTTGSKDTVTSGKGNDTIIADIYSKIDGGAGGDFIVVNGQKNNISGGNGDDYITILDDKNTVSGGKGNDFIFIPFANKNVIKYKTGDGNDTINGYNETDTLKITGDYSTQTSGFSDVLINVGSGSILLKYASGKKININNISETIGELNEKISTYTLPGGFGSVEYVIAGTNGDDDIYNSRLLPSRIKAMVYAGAGNDYVYNWGRDSVTIDGGEGDDSIYNDGDSNVSINGGNGNDSIYNSGDEVTLQGGNGDDTIINYYKEFIHDNNSYGGDDFIAYGGTGNDSITNSGASATILGDAGEDTITNRGSNVKIDGGDDNDKIYIWDGDNVSIVGDKGNDYIYNKGESVKIDLGTGNDTVENSGDCASILGGTGVDSIENYHGDNVTINGGNDNDYISNISSDAFRRAGGNNVSINGGSGNDSIQNDGCDVTIDGGKGNDTIRNTGDNVTIDSGEGNDSIFNACYEISGIIYYYDYTYSRGLNVLFQYSSGDGNDIIYGFREDSTLSISGGSYSTTKNGSNIIVTVGESKISLFGAAKLDKVNIDGATVDEWLTLTNKNKSSVKLSSEIKVADASARTKAINITGNKLANTINGSSKNDSIYGNAGNDSLVGNAGNDKLVGGKGNDSLWGGKGNDSLWGDSGADTFFYYKGDDKDVIFGFDNKDTLTLDGLDFSASYSKKTGTLTFKVDGGSIILKDLGTTTTFHINNDIYKISGSKLIKK